MQNYKDTSATSLMRPGNARASANERLSSERAYLKVLHRRTVKAAL